MIQNINLVRQLKALKLNIDELNEGYVGSLKDTNIEYGLEYDKKYPYNEEICNLFNKAKELKDIREEKVHHRIFYFTQTYYSLKEYLKDAYPDKKKIIEDFFYLRKDICNVLKHNPENHLIYGLGKIGNEVVIENEKRIEKKYYKLAWFYKGKETIEYCNLLYSDLLTFIENL